MSGRPWPAEGSLARRMLSIRSSCDADASMWRRCLDAPVVTPAALGDVPSSLAFLAAWRRWRLSPWVCLLVMWFLSGERFESANPSSEGAVSTRSNAGGRRGPRMLGTRSPCFPPGEQVFDRSREYGGGFLGWAWSRAGGAEVARGMGA